jgi:hypothetical protein
MHDPSRSLNATFLLPVAEGDRAHQCSLLEVQQVYQMASWTGGD